MAEKPQAHPPLNDQENIVAVIAGAGITLLIIAALLTVIGNTDSGTTSTLAAFGGVLVLAGLVLWLVWLRPWENFDDLETPYFTGHHHDDDHVAVLEPGDDVPEIEEGPIEAEVIDDIPPKTAERAPAIDAFTPASPPVGVKAEPTASPEPSSMAEEVVEPESVVTDAPQRVEEDFEATAEMEPIVDVVAEPAPEPVEQGVEEETADDDVLLMDDDEEVEPIVDAVPEIAPVVSDEPEPVVLMEEIAEPAPEPVEQGVEEETADEEEEPNAVADSEVVETEERAEAIVDEASPIEEEPATEAAAEEHPEEVVDKPDKLRIIEGIGPKTEQALHTAGITTFARLSKMSQEEIDNVLQEQSVRIVASTMTWPMQAVLAAEGKKNELDELQARIKNGYLYDDLTDIEGVGEKSQDALNDAEIRSFADLAAADVDHLKSILQTAKISANPGSWPKQAQYLVDGDLSGLRSYQDELRGGN